MRAGLRRLPVVAGMALYADVCKCPRAFELPGGFFSFGMRWRDYYTRVPIQHRARVEAIRVYVASHGLRLTGRDYERRVAVPVFVDGSIGFFTPHGYADLMAAVWSDQDDRDYSYINYLHFRIDPDDFEVPAVDLALTRSGHQ